MFKALHLDTYNNVTQVHINWIQAISPSTILLIPDGKIHWAQILFEAQLFLKLLLQLLSIYFFTADGKGNLTAVWLAGHEIKNVLHRIKRLFTTEFLNWELSSIKVGHKMLSFTI